MKFISTSNVLELNKILSKQSQVKYQSSIPFSKELSEEVFSNFFFYKLDMTIRKEEKKSNLINVLGSKAKVYKWQSR